jgi:hypothetical protein
MPKSLYELDVRLKEIEPPIWRTIEIAGFATLEDVHFAIQVAMGWTNSHLHQFLIDGVSYGMADTDDAGDLELEDERRFRLEGLADRGDSFVYEYDFGDGWEHEITVKKITTVSKAPRARCTGGARACPPEDCGGTGGYADLLIALADPSNEDHRDSVIWAGDFQPERFALPKAGLDLTREMKQLKKLADEGGEEPGGPGPEIGLPSQLVEAVLALEPLHRASLAALIAGSLANELLEVRAAAGSLIDSLNQARATRKRT